MNIHAIKMTFRCHTHSRETICFLLDGIFKEIYAVFKIKTMKEFNYYTQKQ